MYLYQLTRNMGQIPPCNASMLGHQHDSGHYWCILTNTPHGPIPGKGRQGKAWYPYGGREHETTDFSYIHMMHGSTLSLQRVNGPYTPHGALLLSATLLTGRFLGKLSWTHRLVLKHGTRSGTRNTSTETSPSLLLILLLTTVVATYPDTSLLLEALSDSLLKLNWINDF